jgi:hypothetical protein
MIGLTELSGRAVPEPRCSVAARGDDLTSRDEARRIDLALAVRLGELGDPSVTSPREPAISSRSPHIGASTLDRCP